MLKKQLYRNIMLFLAMALAVGLVSLSLFIDVHILDDKVGESSVTECSQEILLFSTVFLFILPGLKGKTLPPAHLLIAGFFACMLIREMDFVFDELHHGSWVWFALATAGACIAYAIKHRRQTLAGLVEFMSAPSYGMMVSGLICILIFSRLFGMNILWQGLLADDFIRAVKNMVEEGTELFGYILCTLSAAWYLAARRYALAGSREFIHLRQATHAAK